MTTPGASPRPPPGPDAPDDPIPGRIAMLRRENDQLREAIGRRPVIEQAKGALILRFGLDGDAAFALLRRWSQTLNIKLHTIAETLVIVVCRDETRSALEPADLAGWLRQQVCATPRGTPRPTV